MKAHGTAVGLPSDADMGNSEVGHNALGSGQVVDQVRPTLAATNGQAITGCTRVMSPRLVPMALTHMACSMRGNSPLLLAQMRPFDLIIAHVADTAAQMRDVCTASGLTLLVCNMLKPTARQLDVSPSSMINLP